MEYICNICNKKYSSYQSLWIHNKKYHKDTVYTMSTFGIHSVYNKNTHLSTFDKHSVYNKSNLDEM